MSLIQNIMLVAGLLLVVLVAIYYYARIHFPTYVELKTVIDCIVGNNKDYMNFGYWEEDTETLSESNENMCRKLAAMGSLSRARRILDVGFGLGEQLSVWRDVNDDKDNLEILGVDIEPAHIQAGERLLEGGSLGHNVSFKQGDACDLPSEDEKFDRVVSLESAFHYRPRNKFFDEAYRVLEPGGKLVIADIVRNGDSGLLGWLPNMVACDFMGAPTCNKESVEEWLDQLRSLGFEVKWEDVTDKTLVPYLNNFAVTFAPANPMLRWAGCLSVSIWSYLCARVRPFSYVLAVCTKPGIVK